MDRSTQIDQDVIRHNVETGGRETLCARVRNNLYWFNEQLVHCLSAKFWLLNTLF